MTDPQPWDAAVAEAAAEPLAAIEVVLRDELINLWTDLNQAYGEAQDTIWSAGCDWLVRRIIRLTRLVGPAAWQEIRGPLLLNGIYEGIMTSAGVEFERPDPDPEWIAACGYTQCPECQLWAGHHTRPCSQRPRTQYEIDKERVAAFYGLATGP